MASGSVDSPASRRASQVISIVFLLASFLTSIAFLDVRNIYDDEIGTTDLLRVSTGRIIQTMNHADVHPPGMYVLSHLGYQLLPSPRWVTIFPLCCLYLGLAVFVFAFVPLFRNRTSLFCFLLLATFHPQFLMWGNSIRWYPWWSGIALLTVVVALQPRVIASPSFRIGRALLLGLLLGALFYLNYITIIFSMALAVGLLVRYGARPWKQYLLTGLIALALVLPQLHAFFTVHLLGSRGQRSNPLFSTARLVQSLFSSEAYLPWHPLAIVAALLFLALSAFGVLRGLPYLRRHRLTLLAESSPLPYPDRSFASVILLALAFLALVAITGLGGKPRNALLLAPLLAPAFALIIGGLRSRPVQYGILGLLALWCSLGITHLLHREGLTKSGMNNRPEEVLNFIKSTRGSDCSVVVTYDPILSFYLVESHVPRLMVLTTSQNTMYQDAAPLAPAACAATDLYIVQSYMGGFGSMEHVLPGQLKQASDLLQPPVRSHSFSFDPDAPIKRRLRFVSGTATLPDYRYIVFSGRLLSTDLTALEDRLPYFTVADGRTEPRLQ